MPDRELDQSVLRQLARHGADLSKTAHIIHFMYFKSRRAADRVASELRNKAYENIRVERSSSPVSLWQRFFGFHRYLCVAETYAVPSESEVFATTDFMTDLAERYGGEYDGWEASVEG